MTQRLWLASLAASLVLMPTLAACGTGNGSKEDQATDVAGTGGNANDPVVVTIGNLTDLTGPSARGNELVNMALEDMIRYANAESMIPGVQLEVVHYDGQLDPARTIPGYEWLKERGADVIWTGVPGAAGMVKARADQDGIVVFGLSVAREDLDPPGYVFSLGIVPDFDAHAILAWIAENDWDYVSRGPARVGGAGWDDAHSPAVFAAAEQYCRMHPDQFEWAGSYLKDFGFVWDTEAVALRDVNYVFPPSIMAPFLKQYRENGGRARIIGGEVQGNFFQLLDDAELWDEVDGSLITRVSPWWNEEDEKVELAKNLLSRCRSSTAEEIIRSGNGYLGTGQASMMLEAIGQAVHISASNRFDSQAFYEVVQELSVTRNGIELYSFTETKRSAANYFAVYRFQAAERDLVRVNDEWYPYGL